MNPLLILQIAELAIGIAKGSTTGQTAKLLDDIAALEQIAQNVAQAYQQMAGKPLDLSLLTFEEPIA